MTDPVKPNGPTKETESRPQLQGVRERARARVLIVDDEPAMGSLMKDALETAGYECETCTSARNAFVALDTRPVDAIISDLHMPEISGLDLLRQIRPSHPFVAFLMMTGASELAIAVEAMKDGSNDYLIKPFQLDEAVKSLQQALERKALEREVLGYRERLEEMVERRTKQLKAALRRIELTYDETLGALGLALDLRDDETAGHSYRVMRYSLAIAERMGCSDEQMTNIARGAFLHDIGKIGIPDAILRKPAKLTDEETAVMQTHVRIGYELVCRIAFLTGAAAIVLTHHERYDGTGYPQGLVGKEIPLGSRIFVVADTLDAMTSDRPYRLALPFSAACEEIRRESGRQFDPEVVQAFLGITEGEFSRIRQARFLMEGPYKRETPTAIWDQVADERFPAKKVPDAVCVAPLAEGRSIRKYQINRVIS